MYIVPFSERNPLNLDPVRLDEGDGIEVTLRANNARYNKSCKPLFNNTKLQRAEKTVIYCDTDR